MRVGVRVRVRVSAWSKPTNGATIAASGASASAARDWRAPHEMCMPRPSTLVGVRLGLGLGYRVRVGVSHEMCMPRPRT